MDFAHGGRKAHLPQVNLLDWKIALVSFCMGCMGYKRVHSYSKAPAGQNENTSGRQMN